MSDTSPDVFEAELAGNTPPKRQKTSLAGLLIIGLFVGIALFPVLYVWAPDELARWYQAAAEEQRLDGDLAAAVDSISHSIRRFPDHAGLLLKRAEWLKEDGKYEAALADCDRVLELVPDSPLALQVRITILHHLERFDAAVEDALKLLERVKQSGPGPRAAMLNLVAYSRALANEELDQALEEIEQSLKLRAPTAATLDTRGFIHYLRGDLDKARKDLDQAVEEIELELDAAEKRLDGEPGTGDLREGRKSLELGKRDVAVLRYHRSLVLESQGEAALAEQDRERVIELGFEPGDQLF